MIGAQGQFEQARNLHMAGDLAGAITAYRQALRLAPDSWLICNALGNALQELEQTAAAIAIHRRAVSLQPDSAEARNDLALCLQSVGLAAEAVEQFRRASSFAGAQENLLIALHYLPDVDREGIYAVHKLWAHRLNGLKQARNPLKRVPGRRLRVGYVSPDFRKHAVAFFIEPILRHHDRTAFEVFCYANVARPDAMTHRLLEQSEHSRFTSGLTDEQLSNLIASDGIDLLVDLAGHTANNRLGVFARKAAPVQATYLGYPDTTGLSSVDYRLTDALADPPGDSDAFYTEKLIRLPGPFLCYQPHPQSPEPSRALPADRTGTVTFGSFNNFAKVTPAVLAAWGQLLAVTPNARLLLKSRGLGDPETQRMIRTLFTAAKIDPARVELIGLTPNYTEHLAVYDRVDIALDTFPYNGTTTTCEALWMGVPVVTLAGINHAGRVGVSLLNGVGLADLIGDSVEHYVAIAIALANDFERLRLLRTSLRPQMLRSPLMNAETFTRDLEATYTEMTNSIL